MFSVGSVPVDDVPRVWHIVAPMLAPAVTLSEGRYDLRAVFDDVRAQRSLLWVVSDESAIIAAFIVAKRQYPRATFLSVDFMGGEGMPSWVDEVDKTLAAFARDSGADGLELVGRKGWGRALAAFGWRDNAVLLVKSVEQKVD